MNKEKILQEYSPKYKKFEYTAPLQVGNGELAIGVDLTGLQTFSETYAENFAPLCTMTQWGWHSTPVSEDKKEYTPQDLTDTVYDFNGRKVKYPTKKTPENVYNWLRENPHRGNLLQLKLVLNETFKAEDLIEPQQVLDLHKGIITSTYSLKKHDFEVINFSHPYEDTLGFKLNSLSFQEEAKLQLFFPYASSEMTGMEKTINTYATKLILNSPGEKIFQCVLDDDEYFVRVSGENFILQKVDEHTYNIQFSQEKNQLLIHFSKNMPQENQESFAQAEEKNEVHWKNFWENCGFIDVTKSKDSRAKELQRRILLSQYLLAIQDSGSIPPQETGLLSNSWYGKFHLEMHLWHSAFMPLWHRSEDLEKSMDWYLQHQKEARDNAEKNHYKGLRWPKMVGPDAIDSPSPIAPLLIWQQSHIIYMLELIYQEKKKKQETDVFLQKYWPLIKGTADFMADFVVLNEEKDIYEMLAPIFPSQERFDPTTVKNPTFELEYWRFGFELACLWGERLNQDVSAWKKVHDRLAKSRIYDGCYLSHENCPETYEKVAIDHPSMLGIYGLIPNDRIDEKAYIQTLDKVLECWDFDTLWGWDFGMMAMAATRLNKPEIAIDILLSNTPKNQYEKNGHNRQAFRHDLPAYLPGNGSLLLALSLMTAGYPGGEKLPGFPKNGQWEVEFSNISPFPY